MATIDGLVRGVLTLWVMVAWPMTGGAAPADWTWATANGATATDGNHPGPSPLSPTTEAWRYDEAGYQSFSSPITAGDLVITVGDAEGLDELIALDAGDGRFIWARTGKDGAFASFASSGDRLFINGGDGTLTAVSALTGRDVWTSRVRVESQSRLEGVFADGERVYVSADAIQAVDQMTGAALWTFQQDIPGAAIVEVAGETVFIAARQSPVLVALDAATGEERWRYVAPVGSLHSSDAADGTTVVTTFNSGSGVGGMIALDVATGVPLWQFDLDGAAITWDVLSPDSVYVCDSTPGAGGGPDRVLSIDRFSGLLHWSVDVECGGLAVTSDALHFASGGKGERLLTSLDIYGTHRWTVEVDGAFDEVFAPLVADDTLFVGTTSDRRVAELIALRPGPDSGLAFPAVAASDAVPASAGTGATVEAPVSEATALVPDCTPFANYDEAQVYYATYPQAQPIIDPDYDGRACEGYFLGGDPIVVEVPAATGTTGGSAGGDTGGNTDGNTGGGGNTGGSTGGGIIYTEFGGLDGVDYDCYDFATPSDAQAYFVADGGSVYNNSDGLDRNHNGLACEPGEFD